MKHHNYGIIKISCKFQRKPGKLSHNAARAKSSQADLTERSIKMIVNNKTEASLENPKAKTNMENLPSEATVQL